MTLEVLVIAVVRIAGSLPVLRWALAGGTLAVAVDLSHLLLREMGSARVTRPGGPAVVRYDPRGRQAWRRDGEP